MISDILILQFDACAARSIRNKIAGKVDLNYEQLDWIRGPAFDL